MFCYTHSPTSHMQTTLLSASQTRCMQTTDVLHILSAKASPEIYFGECFPHPFLLFPFSSFSSPFTFFFSPPNLAKRFGDAKERHLQFAAYQTRFLGSKYTKMRLRPSSAPQTHFWCIYEPWERVCMVAANIALFLLNEI